MHKAVIIAAMAFNIAGAHAACFKVDDENPVVTVAGKIIPAPKIKTGPDKRGAGGPFIRLRELIEIDAGGGCEKWREIPIMGKDVKVWPRRQGYRHAGPFWKRVGFAAGLHRGQDH